MSDAKGAKEEAPLRPEQIQEQYQRLKQEYDAVGMKIAEMEGEKHEHQLVLKALQPLDDDRRCYRAVGGVLVERTAKDVKPALEESVQRLDGTLKALNTQAATKQKELQAFVEKHKLSGQQSMQQQQQQQQPDAEAAKKEDKKATGVLA